MATVLRSVDKGALFNVLMVLINCCFGFRVRPDKESLSDGTSRAFLTGLSAVLIVDAVLVIVFCHLGM
jgi:phospholipid/cholesterol/gamma-HCH transport system permease protein